MIEGRIKKTSGISRQTLPEGQKENKMSISNKSLGFQPSFLTHFPLPRTRVGNEFRRTVNGIKCIYMDPLGIPYTTNERRWIEITTTLAKQIGSTWVEFGAVSHAMERYGMDRSSRYILPARRALYKFANLHISTMKVANIGGMEAHQAINLTIAKKAQILWARGRTDLVVPELFDGQNFMELSDEFMGFVATAAPHVQEHYMQIQSPLTLDLYHWLVTKLYTLNNEELIKWSWLYSQFGQGGRLNDSQMKSMRRLIKASLFDILNNYYTKARVGVTDEGIILKKSPLLIEPDSKKAGFSLL